MLKLQEGLGRSSGDSAMDARESSDPPNRLAVSG